MIDKLFFNFTRASALLILIIVAWIFTVLFNHSLEAMNTLGLDFITHDEWAPNLDKFGAYAAILGSIISTTLAMMLAVPIAIGVAIFLSEIAHDKIKGFFGVSVELLAAIPSVIYGMWGLFFFVPIIRDLFGGLGIGLLAAGIVLAIMILPFM
ncbi:MAG: phosphate transport system permease protein, partial [Campylobacterota bacterium]|nr:phosphate transport system permease protein [Campylobacterota bacterium]